MYYGESQVVRIVPVVDLAAYASGDVVGGLQSVEMNNPALTGILKHVTITDAANQKKPYTILFFSALPAAAFADQGALALSAADLALVTGKVNILATDYETLATRAVATVETAICVRGDPTTKLLYFLVVTTDAPDFAAVTDLGIVLGIIKD